MKRDNSVYLQHILQEITDIKRYLNNVRHDEFLQNDEKQKAVIRSLEIIGEAVKHIDSNLKGKYPSIPWRKIASFRDLVIHEYFRVDIELVWYVATDSLVELEKEIIAITNELKHI